MTIIPYAHAHRDAWDTCIKTAVNGSFLFQRDFMEYHSDRFIDASLLVYDADRLVSCVPAHRVAEGFYSHQGLSYGGFINLAGTNTQAVGNAVLQYIKAQGFKRVVMNPQLSIYNPLAHGQQAFFKNNGFTVTRTYCNMHVSLLETFKIASKKTAGYRNFKFSQLSLHIETDVATFWKQLLIPQLYERYDTVPVHTLDEITLLAARFPESIKQYHVYRKTELLAGVTFFLQGNVAKSQYAASSAAGRACSAMDFLYIEAMHELKQKGYEVLDLGHVNNPDGSINRGLQRFKEELGCVTLPSLQFSKQFNDGVF